MLRNQATIGTSHGIATSPQNVASLKKVMPALPALQAQPRYIGESARALHFAPTISHDPRSPRSVQVQARNDVTSFPLTAMPTRADVDCHEHSLSDQEMSGINGHEMGPISPGLLCELTQLTTDVSFEKECHDAGIDIELKASNSSSSSSSTGNSPKKATKKRKKRKKSKDVQHGGVSYYPTSAFRAQGNIQIAKQLTEQIIPERIAEVIPSVYAFMDKSTALAIRSALRVQHNGTRLLVLNYGFHDERSGEALFCVAAQQDRSATASRGYALRMLNELFDADELCSRFAIDAQHAPKSFRETPIFAEKLRHGNAIQRALLSEEERRRIIEETPWHKIAIFNKVNNKRRMTLSVTKPEFQREMTAQLGGMGMGMDMQLMPMVMFASAETQSQSQSESGCEFWVEHVLLVALDEAVDVGVAFVVEAERVRVSGIHLDGEFMRLNYEVLFPGQPCAALSGFASAINYLSIGNPDDALNKIKYYQQQIQELSEKLHQKTAKAKQQAKQQALQQQQQQLYQQQQQQQQQQVCAQVCAQAMARNVNYGALSDPYAMCNSRGHAAVNAYNANVMAQFRGYR